MRKTKYIGIYLFPWLCLYVYACQYIILASCAHLSTICRIADLVVSCS